MESSLRSFGGPRIKYTPDDSPYESITVDKLTPIIGGEIGPCREMRSPVPQNITVWSPTMSPPRTAAKPIVAASRSPVRPSRP